MNIKRVKKLSQAGMLFFAALFIFSQVSHVESTDVTYWAEVMIEGNKTLNVASLLPDLIGVLDPTSGVTIINAEIAAECEIIGRNTTCWCGTGYVWSNNVCDNVNACCNAAVCVANISDFTPLCLPKVNVSLIGTMTGSASTLPLNIEPAFRVLNAFNAFNGTGSVLTGLNTYQHNFTVTLFSVFSTAKVQGIVSTLLTNATFYSLNLKTLGMVYIEAPEEKLCYNARQQLNCTCIEQMDSCMWQMTRDSESPMTLGPGSQVMLSDVCTTTSTVTLLSTNGFWSGTYSCLFTTKNIAHMALAPISIALLPEVINVTATAPTADCTSTPTATIVLNCTIETSIETYTAKLKIGAEEQVPTTQVSNGIIMYTASFSIDCAAATKPRSYDASCTLENTRSQLRNRTIKLPVIYPGDGFCAQEVIADRTWPKTKDNETATLFCTEVGKQGMYTRKCNGNTWAEEISLCVKAVLNTITSQASDFEKGLGATQEIASYIFESLRNNTAEEGGNGIGDVQAAVSVFKTMKSASANMPLGENLVENFLESASSMLNISWDVGDPQVTNSLATQYLASVENLMYSIRINNSNGYNSSNIQLGICKAGSSCNQSVFNVEVGLNATADLVKTMGIQNLAERMPKVGFENALFPSIVVSTTAENRSSSAVNIKMAFQTEESGDMHCVFWNVTEERWSTDGCEYVKSATGTAYCECNHLTSFAMLMSKFAVSLPFMDQLTYIGLGVSICSLIVYIIIEALVWKTVVKSSLSHFRHTALINISMCLLLADICFLASAFPSILSETACLILVVAKHYFFLAMFFWMLSLSIMLAYQLIFVFSHISKKVYMIIGYTLGYVCPTLTVAATYVYYDQTKQVEYFSTKTCWLTYQSAMVGSIYAFLFPVGFIVFANMCSMVVVIATVLKPSGAEADKKADKEAAKAVIKVVLFLTPVFGGTWVLGFLVFIMDDFTQFTTILVQYAFTIVNSLQGFFILLTGCFAEKRVRDEILRIIMGKPAKDGK
ncbi:adhesion G-protein coupled receptor F3 isoform X1 [Paramisgurnus dabryanus]|uniref:adhesion G-protein coupled receptor F3 isoform X1 n=2 Tax=Paramisgurnus dabryanus TaxID=90735 RepID=UPI0031F45511